MTPRPVRRHRGRVPAALMILAFATAMPAAAAAAYVDVRVQFDGPPAPPAVVDAMFGEAAAIWDGYGVQLRWWTPAAGTCVASLGSFDVLVDRRASPDDVSRGILGRTVLAGGAIDHVPVRIHRTSVQSLLDRMPLGQMARTLGRLEVGSADVGRALGRVLAHELGHVLLNAAGHQHRGLMRATFSADELVQPGRAAYGLSPLEVDRLKARARGLLVPAGDSGACAPRVP